MAWQVLTLYTTKMYFCCSQQPIVLCGPMMSTLHIDYQFTFGFQGPKGVNGFPVVAFCYFIMIS